MTFWADLPREEGSLAEAASQGGVYPTPKLPPPQQQPKQGGLPSPRVVVEKVMARWPKGGPLNPREGWGYPLAGWDLPLPQS